jgi:RNA polymerase sigma factor (sigma-70 family)
MDFSILVKKITPALRAIARRNVLRGFHDTDDLFQQMCLYLWQRFADGMPIGMNEAYIIKSCEFYLLNFLRQGRRMPSHVSMDIPMTDTGLTLKDTLTSDCMCRSRSLDTYISINEIKNKKLTRKERVVLDLILKGHTMREIADSLGISHVMVLKYKKNIIKKSKTKGYQS